jgi:predicted PurR-regulated permease PerM
MAPVPDGARPNRPSRPETDVAWPVRLGASWTWRLLLLAAGAVLLVRALADLRLVVVPVIVALFLTTLLLPPTQWLRERGVPSAIAAAATLLTGLGVVVGVFVLIGPEVASEFDDLGRQVRAGAEQLIDWIGEGPLALARDDIQQALQTLLEQGQASAGTIGGGLVSGAILLLELAAGLLVALVLTFFFLKDGRRMWEWFLGLFDSPANRRDAHELGDRVWVTMTSYVRGLVVVALFDAVFIGIALWIIGVPLVLPLAVLTFFGAFIPIVGAVAAGAAAALVALVTGGLQDAVLVVAATVVIQQIESEALYPVVVGRALQLHPVPILLAVTAGGVLYGIGGAALAAPLLATVVTAASFARERKRRQLDDGAAGHRDVETREPAPAQ